MEDVKIVAVDVPPLGPDDETNPEQNPMYPIALVLSRQLDEFEVASLHLWAGAEYFEHDGQAGRVIPVIQIKGKIEGVKGNFGRIKRSLRDVTTAGAGHRERAAEEYQRRKQIAASIEFD